MWSPGKDNIILFPGENFNPEESTGEIKCRKQLGVAEILLPGNCLNTWYYTEFKNGWDFGPFLPVFVVILRH